MADHADQAHVPAIAEPAEARPVADPGERHETLEARSSIKADLERGKMLNRRPALMVQRRAVEGLSGRTESGPQPIQPASKRVNRSGLPDTLKEGIESLSGLAMDDVRVHRNSPRPKQLDALAYTQGTEIHLAPGQDRHLAHEAWHVVQQAEGRVRPTIQMKGAAINAEEGLEREADEMGARASRHRAGSKVERSGKRAPAQPPVVQRIIDSAAFALQTPAGWFSKRKSVTQIDAALDTYHAANQAAKLAALDNLIAAIDTYIRNKIQADDAANVRIRPAANLLNAAAVERLRVLKLDALANAPNGLVPATLADTLNPPLANLSVQQINAYLAPGHIANLVQLADVIAKLDLLANAPNGAVAAAIADTANAPLSNLSVAELREILRLGHIANLVDLQGLLTAATSAVGAGSAALRLQRVLAQENPPHTPNALQGALVAKRAIDEKILRGRVDTPLGPNEEPQAEHRNLIGGHSPSILTDTDTFVADQPVVNQNATRYVGFRKLVRADATGFAAAVNANANGNIVATLDLHAQTGLGIAANPPAFPQNFLARAPANIRQQRQAAQAAAVQTVQGEANRLAQRRQAAINAAVNAAAHPNSATALAPFAQAVIDLHASANLILNAAQQVAANTVNANAANAAIAQLQTAIDGYRAQGPVLSASKNSTLPPPGMSEDDVLRMGDRTVAVPATLIRHDATLNNPADGQQVETKHQLLANNVVWVAMKEQVVFHRPVHGPVTLTGGRLTSSYPTLLTAIPGDAVYPLRDADRFSTIP